MHLLQNGCSNSNSKIDITPEEERLLDAMSFKRKQQSFQTMRTSRDGSRVRARTYDSRQRSPQSVRNTQGKPGFVCSRCGKKNMHGMIVRHTIKVVSTVLGKPFR